MPARSLFLMTLFTALATQAWPIPHAMAAEAAQAPAPAQAPLDAAQAQKSVRALVNAIRYNKDAVAAKHLDFDGMARLLLADSFAAASPKEQKAFVADLSTLVTVTSFPKGRDLFGYLDALLFETATPKGDTLHVKSVVVVHRNLKKVELPIEWVLTRSGKDYRVVDIISMNESTAQGIREEEVLPLMHEGGLPKVMEALHDRAQEVRAKAPEAQAKPKVAP